MHITPGVTVVAMVLGQLRHLSSIMWATRAKARWLPTFSAAMTPACQGDATVRSACSPGSCMRNSSKRFPDRLLLLRMQDPGEHADRTVASPWHAGVIAAEKVGSHLALARVAHMIEDRCRSWPNTIATTVTPGVMCIFTTQKSRVANHERLLLEE